MRVSMIFPRIFLSLLFGFTVFAPAQNTNTPDVGPAQTDQTEALHQSLRDLRDTMQAALNRHDLDALLANVADDVVFTTMNGDRVIGKDGIRQYFEKMLNGPEAIVQSVNAQFEVDALSHLYHDDTAIAFGHSNDAYVLSNGDAFTITPQWSATLIREGERWQIANFHYSVNLFDNPVLEAQRKWLLGGGAIAVLLAGLIGFALGRRRHR